MTQTVELRPRSSRDRSSLPAPMLGNWQWQVQAACRGLSTDLFFKADDEPRSRKRSKETQAKAVCDDLPGRNEMPRLGDARRRDPRGLGRAVGRGAGRPLELTGGSCLVLRRCWH